MSTLVFIIAGMAIVTYIPRLGAAVAGSRIDTLPLWSRKWLRGIPFAIFGALIVPGIWTSVPGSSIASLSGAAVGAVLALLNAPAILSVLSALAVAVLVIMQGY